LSLGDAGRWGRVGDDWNGLVGFGEDDERVDGDGGGLRGIMKVGEVNEV
jgi:hypothetical protein